MTGQVHHWVELWTWHGEYAGLYQLPDTGAGRPGRWLVDPQGRAYLNLGFPERNKAWHFQQTLDTPPTGTSVLMSDQCIRTTQETAA